jgi:glyoxylase-like metal-dependent hydrolase (beta-lactamase superfamily II)
MTAWDWTLLRAGTLRLDGGGMFGVVPKVLWSRMTKPDEQNRILLQTNCLSLTDGKHRVLIETGFGDKWAEKDRDIFALEKRTVVDALNETGVDAADITHVVVSHLHFDHAAGLTRLDKTGTPELAFPNAGIFAQRTEWEDALANKSTMTKTYLRSHLDPISDRIELLDGKRTAIAGTSLRVEPAPGHTWGQQMVLFEDSQGTVCFAGDVIPTANHVGPAFSIGYDMMPYQNMLTKLALLERAEREGWRLVLDHEPGNPVMRVKRDAARPERFEFIPAEELTT